MTRPHDGTVGDMEREIRELRAERDAAYERGRADERADLAAWLRDECSQWRFGRYINDGAHVGAAKNAASPICQCDDHQRQHGHVELCPLAVPRI